MLVVPVVPRALKPAYRERCRACPYQVIFRRQPATPFATIADEGFDAWTVERIDPKRVKALVGELMQAHEQQYQSAIEHVRANRERMRTSILLPNLHGEQLHDGGLSESPLPLAKAWEHVEATLAGGISSWTACTAWRVS